MQGPVQAFLRLLPLLRQALDECISLLCYSALGPRSREKTAEMRISPEKTRRACCSPGRNPPREPFAVWTLMIRLGLPIMPTSFSYGTSAVMSARTSGMLATMLVLMMVTLTAEEIPLFEAGTEPMTELAFGLRNRPIPNPTNTSPTTIWE